MDAVHVWRSKNPSEQFSLWIRGSETLPRELTLNMNIGTADMTTSISNRFRPMEQISTYLLLILLLLTLGKVLLESV